MATTNYGWVTPTDGGSNGAWGALLNTLFQAIDSALFAVSAVASAALPKGGGVMTGRLDSLVATMARVDKGSVSGAQSLDLAVAQYFTIAPTAGVVLTFANTPTSVGATAMIIRSTNGGTRFTWPASVKWPSGTAPTLTVAGVDLIVLITDDDGTTWRGVVVARDVR